MRFPAAFLFSVFSAISFTGQSLAQATDAYEVTTIAGVETASGLRDGVGESANFIGPTALWGDGTYLYVGDGPALRRIEIATRRVTTITRLAGSGRYFSDVTRVFSGLGGLWGDGSNIYATDLVDTGVRRIDLSTGLVDVISGPTGILLGLVGDGRYLYGAASAQHNLKRVDLTTGATVDFATPPGPLDPSRCITGSSCINYFVPSPTSLSVDGDNIYATGFNTTLRIISRLTGGVTTSPALPFIPNSVWGRDGVLYYTEDRGNRIGKLVLATGEAAIVYSGDPSRGGLNFVSVFSSIWGDGRFLYLVESDHILQLDLTTGQLQHFAGRNPAAGTADGVGAAARFTNPSKLWSDGANLYIVDSTIRKLNLTTAEVTTLPTPPVRSVWGDGTNLYATSYQSGGKVLRIHLSDGAVTTVAALPDPNGGNGITGDGTNLYVSETDVIERVPLNGGAVSAIPLWMPFYGGSDIWSDGASLFIASTNKIVRYAIATGETTDFAILPGFVRALWGDGQNLFVTGSRLWRVSLATGEIHTLMRGGTGEGAGTPLDFGGFVGGAAGNLYLDNGTAVYKLMPAAMPSFSSFSFPDRGAGVNVTAPDAAIQPTATGPANATAIGSGAIMLDSSSGASSGLAIISYRQNGIVVSETTVPATAPIQAGRFYAVVSGAVNTGLAIMNPNDQPAAIHFYFTNSNGDNFGSGNLTIPAHGQITRFLNEAPFTQTSPFALPGVIDGTLTFESTVPVAAVAVRGYTNERSQFLMTTVPVSDLAQVPSSAPAILPHFAQGGGWTTSVVLVNRTDYPIGGSLETYSDEGSLLSTAPYTVAPRSSFLYRMSSAAEVVGTGWIQIVPSGAATAPAGMAIFSFQEGGITVTEAATETTDATTSSRIYTENSGGFQLGLSGTLGTGLAIANPSLHSATVYFDVTSSDGMPIRTSYPTVASLTIPARGHRSAFLSELFVPLFPLPLNGVLRIWTDSPDGVSLTGFRGRYNERNDFLIAATPAAPESAAATASTTYFPTIVQGGGYTTEMIVFGRSPGRSTSGSIRYFSQSGAALTIPLN